MKIEKEESECLLFESRSNFLGNKVLAASGIQHGQHSLGRVKLEHISRVGMVSSQSAAQSSLVVIGPLLQRLTLRENKEREKLKISFRN